MVLQTNSIKARQMIASLPLSTAIFYASLCAVSFWFYTALWSSAPITMNDSPGFFRTAQDFPIFTSIGSNDRPPGYPLLLLLTGANRSPRTLFFVSLLLHFVSIWLLGIVLYRAGLTQSKLNLFSLILLLPPFVEPAAYILSENLTEAMLVAAFVSFIFWHLNKRIIWILISSASIGYAALTRPTYQVLALAMAGYLVASALPASLGRSKVERHSKRQP